MVPWAVSSVPRRARPLLWVTWNFMKARDRLKTKAASLLRAAISAVLIPTSPAVAGADCPASKAVWVRVGNQPFRVEAATGEKAREFGLSRRASLPADAGMWFVMPKPDWHGFWMKDMAFPIDLVWIGPDRVVVGVLGLKPCSAQSCPIHYPPSPVAYVLEVNAQHFPGKPGDRVEWFCAPPPAP